MLSKELEVTLNLAFKEARDAHHEFMTVEHLSELRDDIKLKIPGALQLSQRAKDWLAASADSGALSKMRTEREEQDERIATLEKQLEEMKKSFKPAAAGK